jgi:hypothetical protein
MQMRRVSGLVLAGAMLILPAMVQSAFAQEAAPAQQAQQGQQQPAPAKTTFDGDSVILIYAVNPGQDAQYEQVIAKLKDALAKSARPEAKQQAAGWSVFKSQKPLTQDGASTYIHVINPVVKGADYTITNIVYEVSNDDEKRAFYELYRGALKGVLSAMVSNEVSDLGQ